VVDTLFSQFGFASFGGALSFGYQHPLALIAAIAMVTVMATIPAHERETDLLDLILTRPLPRSRYLTAHLLLVLFASTVAPLALLAGGVLGLAVVEAPEPVAWTAYVSSAGAMALLLFAVGSYSLLIATGAKRRGVAVARGIGITLVFFWLDFMGEYWDLLETARLVSPFHYFDPAAAANYGLPFGDGTVLLCISIAATTWAFWNFRRQDL
jgi:ABC-type transport system involved in multi-copper enzyme maturation permease subunit